MIFATVGTSKFQFERFILLIDTLPSNLQYNDVVVQTGFTKLLSSRFKNIKFLNNHDYIEMIQSCNLIVSHCGIGIARDAVNYKKRLILVPRDPKKKEHTDYHQFDLAKKWNELRMADVIYPDSNPSILNELLSKKNSESNVNSLPKSSDIISNIKLYLEQGKISNSKI